MTGILGRLPRLQLERALILGLALLLFGWGAARTPLFDLDEGAFSEATLEMLRGGDWLRTSLNGEPRYDKPMLAYWLQAASVQLLGVRELAFRLPSILAAACWVLAVFNFTLEKTRALSSARFAAACCGLALMVAVVGHAATADALLNLWLALALFDIYRHSREPRRSTLLRTFLWMGLGFLTKGPIAIALPAAASFLFYLSEGRFRDWLRTAFHPLGWVILVAVIGVWLLPLFLRGQGDFFWQFLLQHNVGRVATAQEGHSGGLWYYFVWLPLVLLPFSVMLPRALAGWRKERRDPLGNYLLITFALVFVLFSFVATKLPHYMLYGCTPLFVLFGREHRSVPRYANVPALLFCALLASLPLWLPWAIPPTRRAFEHGIFVLAAELLNRDFLLAAGAIFLAMLAATLWPLPRWQRLSLAGALQALLVWGFVVPIFAAAQQAPVKAAAELARASGLPTVSYRTALPSFSVYMGRAIESRQPRPGELVFLRRDRLQALLDQLPESQFQTLYSHGGIALLQRNQREMAP